jgi:imidazolonepropionase
MSKLFYNIGTIWGVEQEPAPFKSGIEMGQVARLSNAWILVDQGRIQDFGQGAAPEALEKIDMLGCEVLPGFVDSHTHAVFATERSEEFVMRIKGAGYEEIAAAGGGILNSARKLRAMSEADLYAKAASNVKKLLAHGSTTLEIKSGYGLDLDSELKMLRVIARLKQEFPIQIKATFLGAHAVPPEFSGNREAYVDFIINTMLPAVVAENLADHIDVFCDRGFFTPDETERILEAGRAYDLPGKIHANELGYTGGVQVAVANGAWSADHLEHCGSEEIEAFKQGTTMPVGLPGTSYFLGIPYAPARAIMDAGLPFCLASDFNPGSSPLANMQMVWSLACTQMKMTPEEAFNAITLNAARALRLEQHCGSIARGKRADFVSTKTNNALYNIPYYFGQNHIEAVFVAGEKWVTT